MLNTRKQQTEHRINLNRKKIAVLLLTSHILLALIVSVGVYAASISNIQTIGQGVALPYNYNIFAVSGTYYAKDQNGYVEFSDTDAATVFNDVIAACSDGYTIGVQSTITLDSPITIDKSLEFFFPQYPGFYSPNVISSYTGADTLITITGEAVTLHKMFLDGANVGSNNILLQVSSYFITFDDCQVKRSTDTGVVITGSSPQVFGELVVHDCDGIGVNASASAGRVEFHMTFLKAVGCGLPDGQPAAHFTNTHGYILRMQAGGGSSTYGGDALTGLYCHSYFETCFGVLHIEDTTQDGVVFGYTSGAAATQCRQVAINQLFLYDLAKDSTGTDYVPAVFNSVTNMAINDLYLGGEADYTIWAEILNVDGLTINHVQVPVTDTAFSRGAFSDGDIVFTNGNSVLQNYGSSTGTGAEQTIAHGLVGTPNIVVLSNGDAASNPYQSSAADATNIYVTADSGETWFYYVRYEP